MHSAKFTADSYFENVLVRLDLLEYLCSLPKIMEKGKVQKVLC
jgi:hypothetical protein